MHINWDCLFWIIEYTELTYLCSCHRNKGHNLALISIVTWTNSWPPPLFGKQDKDDDIKVGVKSTALRFQGQTKTWLSGFAVAMMSGLITAGINAEQTLPYYATLSTVAIHLIYQVRRLNSGLWLLQRAIVLLKQGVLKWLFPPSYRFTHWISTNQRTAGRNLPLTETLGFCSF